jgi:hypothetical protein
MRIAVAAFCLIVSTAFILQYDPRVTGEWPFNSGTKHLMEVIRYREAGRDRAFQVSGDPEYKFPSDFYRLRWKMAKMGEVKFGGPLAVADYYLFHGGDRQEKAARFNVTVIEDIPLCACLLAARQPVE